MRGNKIIAIILSLVVITLLSTIIYQFSDSAIQQVNQNHEDKFNEELEENCLDCLNINDEIRIENIEIWKEVFDNKSIPLSLDCQYIFPKTL